MTRQLLLLAAVTLLWPMPVQAMPPAEGVTLSEAELDEQARLGINVIEVPVRDAGMRGRVNRPGNVVPLVTGTKRFPVVGMRYPDVANINSIAQFDSMLFGNWVPTPSARAYYAEVSYGQFNMTGAVFGWYMASHNRSYYAYPNWVAAAELAKEAASLADPAVNFAQYDNDGDGYVDAFTCIHVGRGAEEGSSGDIWSHAWSFNEAGIGEYTTNDPRPGYPGQYIKVNNYTMDPERSGYSNRSGMVCIGVFCHEWGHALALPDLYDTRPGGSGLGTWSLMASGSWGGNNSSPWYPSHLDPWAKMQLGWWNPRAVRARGLYSIPQVETNSRGYWLMSRARPFKEYFLVENRQKTLFDVNLYGSGLLIYHIDDSLYFTLKDSNCVNAGIGGAPYGVALEQADGANHLYTGSNRGDANDPWPGGLGRTTFDSTSTTPNSRTNYPLAGPLVSGCRAWYIPASSPTAACSLLSGPTGQFTGGPDGGGYKWIDSDTAGGPSYGWNDISGSGTLLGYGDNVRWQVNLPYTFVFYGVPYTTMWVCTNGWLSFGADPGTNEQGNVALPNPAAPNSAVYALWDDLNALQSDSGGIYYRHFGSSPNCSTVVMWKHVRHKNVNGGELQPENQLSFEVLLVEQNNRVVLRYRDCSLEDTVYNWGRSATIGIENGSGSAGLQYLYNGTPLGNLVTNERAVEFEAHNVGPTKIVAPGAAVDSGVVVTPACSVHNYGTRTENYTVRMRIGSLYNQTASVSSHAPGTAQYVTFSTWTAQPRGTLAVACSTELTGDNAPGNDRQTGQVVVGVTDAEVLSIDAPTSPVDSGSSVPVRATVRNNGSAGATFQVRFDIVGTGYSNTQTVTLGSGAQQQVNFANWSANVARGNYALRCTTMLAGDMVPANNLRTGQVTVRVIDAEALSIDAPTSPVDSGASVPVRATVRNNSSAAATFQVRFDITGSGYSNTQTVTLGSGVQQQVSFANWVANVARGNYGLRCTTMLAGDLRTANDLRTGQVTVRVIDAEALSIDAPSSPVDSGASVPVRATVRNNGSAGATFQVRFDIPGTGYSNTQTVTLGSGVQQQVSFANWVANVARGNYALRCTTMLAGDLRTANDLKTGQVALRIIDAQALSIDAPTGLVDSGTNVVPQATVRNNGTGAATFDVRMTIGSGYTNTQTVASLGPGASRAVSFAPWTAIQRGTFATVCTVQLAGDMVPANNRVSDYFGVAVHDVGVVAITSPAGIVTPGLVTPSAVVRNYGTQREPVRVVFAIRASRPYRDSLFLANGLPFADTTVLFASWNASVGRHVGGCTTRLATDQVPANNGKSLAFTAGSPGWTPMKPVPDAPSLKQVKDGGWLAIDQQLIYGLKGNKATDFYSYDPADDTWRQLAPMRGGIEGKPPSKGASGCSDGNGLIYATKGNNTSGFWKYFVQGDSWSQKSNVPLGLSNKKLKGGTDIVWAHKGPVGSPYLLKGYKNEFYRYDVSGDSWQTLQPAPVGRSAKWDRGSWLAYDDVSRKVYAHKAKYHEFYAYDITADSWLVAPALQAMPIPGSAGSKKSKDGGCGVWFDSAVYALKGGGTQEFWRYDVAGDSWHEMDTMPTVGTGLRKKKVKAGADIVTMGDGVLYALKGNKTNEFWRYILPAMVTQSRPWRDGVAAAQLPNDDWRLAIGPNPVTGGLVTIRLSPFAVRHSPLTLRIYDAAGRCVQSAVCNLKPEVPLDLRAMPAGVYLVRLRAGAFSATRKLVVQR